MAMDSLPTRPLTLAEGRALHRSDAFRMVAPASAHTARGEDERLVSALVLVRDGIVQGVGYDLADDEWTIVYSESFEEDGDAERADADGVVEEAETRAHEANEALREWAGHEDREFEAVEDSAVAAEAGESERARALFARYRSVESDAE
ncbi:hypothetical protein MBEHAL_2697 [Halarchaeum acidiphilum MH1-52-1]|uniref:DUF7964 domain-containing protein n=1 Tax=Halarchaeum acidiphilum MH1-52-1 TaxID=1261545 RepID=U2YYQ8_9EURY|nr:hypothetical protein [Halarchaeum acidiphilum]GAD53937.1 hypothetical protein MBEHAL_2697 [Halarchaeum acidiphilum MH1-52-1]